MSVKVSGRTKLPTSGLFIMLFMRMQIFILITVTLL